MKWRLDSTRIPTPKCTIRPFDETLINKHDYHTILDNLYIFEASLFSHKTKIGNCGNLAALCIEYLWTHSEDIHVLYKASIKDADHSLVIVELDNQQGYWIIDPWLKEGEIYHSSRFNDYHKSLTNFFKNENTWMGPGFEDNDIVFHVNVKIDPHKSQYPKNYSDFLDMHFSDDMQLSQQPTLNEELSKGITKYKKK